MNHHIRSRFHLLSPVVVSLFMLLGLGVMGPIRAETKWIRMRTANFEVYSSIGERQTRNTLKYFEQVREFFIKLNGREPKSPAPAFIVIFGNRKDAEAAGMKPSTFGYFAPIGDRDYLVLYQPGDFASENATHEYTHLITSHSGLRYPVWLNEGLAEFFSTFTVLNNSVTIGDPIPGRVLALRKNKWVPLSVIMSADENSPYYRDPELNDSLYNEGWAAVHLLYTFKDYRPKFPTFLTEMSKGKSVDEVLQDIYGKSLSEFEAELRVYISQNEFAHLVAKFEIDRSKKDAAAEPAPPFDLQLALSDVDVRPNASADHRKILEELKNQNPKRPEPWSGLAYLDLRERKTANAFDNFTHAYSLGSRTSRLLWDYGRMAQGSRPDDSVKALAELATMEPARVDVRIELAWSQYNAKKFDEALKTLNGITIENLDQAPRFFSALALTQLATGDRTAASRTTDILVRYAKTDNDRAMVDRIRRALQ